MKKYIPDEFSAEVGFAGLGISLIGALIICFCIDMLPIAMDMKMLVSMPPVFVIGFFGRRIARTFLCKEIKNESI